jgi:hypothetical protein
MYIYSALSGASPFQNISIMSRNKAIDEIKCYNTLKGENQSLK